MRGIPTAAPAMITIFVSSSWPVPTIAVLLTERSRTAVRCNHVPLTRYAQKHLGGSPKRSLLGGRPRVTPAYFPATAACDDANRVARLGQSHPLMSRESFLAEVEVFPVVVIGHQGQLTVRARSLGGVGEQRASTGRS